MNRIQGMSGPTVVNMTSERDGVPSLPLARPTNRNLGTKLLLLLLLFGMVPFSTAIIVGYGVSRSAILDQAHHALKSITAAQATHFTTELNRERLLLRTIAGQLPDTGAIRAISPALLSAVLLRSLPEDGVFDGLRLITVTGEVLATVALRQVAPHWPVATPATDWRSTPVVTHREDGLVLAYLLAAPIPHDPSLWLEGHVRAEDFRRNFSVPEHLLPGAESAVFEQDRNPVFGTHEHASTDLAAMIRSIALDSIGSHLSDATPSALIATAPIPESNWSFVTTLPVDVALAPLARLRDSAILGAGALALLIILTAIVAARSVTMPLRELAEATRSLGRAEGHAALPVHSTDEVGQLVTSFNAMVTDLDRSRVELERLHERDMERAQQLATVGELASGVAHEIRNPLTGVRGALDLALRKIPEGDPSHALLVEAQRQLTRINSTTTQLLQFARPPALRDITVNANLLLERAAAIVAPRAVSAAVVLSVESSPVPLYVRADPELMVQVLVNLLLNGIDAMSAGGRLTIWGTHHAPSAWLGVTDTGPGVPDSQRTEIFRPFVSTKHQGTGLGLSISREIVVRHGGTLTLHDTRGEGATFVATLPLAEKD